MQTNFITQNIQNFTTPVPRKASPDGQNSSTSAFPAELFTPEALEACPYARAMFEKMKDLQKSSISTSAPLAESGTWIAQKAPGNFSPTTTAISEWPSKQVFKETLSQAAKNVPDNSLDGRQEADFRAFTRKRIDTIQQRQLNEGCPAMQRLVHTEQLFGGEVEVHWNPHLEQVVNLFDQSTLGGLIRISDASNTRDPDGKSMYGMALELVGNDGQLTDILLTGGSDKTEASQAKDPKAQLALFNMLDHPFTPAGLAQMAWEVGPLEAGKMVLDVGRMKSELNSVADLTAWSRAPFRLTGKDGNDYLVKMRALPLQTEAGQASTFEGETTSKRLRNEFRSRATQDDTRWRFDLQFMQVGDDPNDGRKTWSGPWLAAGEIVVPKIKDAARAEEMSQAAEDVKFNIWKGKEAHDQGPDANVFAPHGWTNQARLWAYGQSAANRGMAG